MLSLIFFFGGGGGEGEGRGYVPDHLRVLEIHAHSLSKQVRGVPIIPTLNRKAKTLSNM